MTAAARVIDFKLPNGTPVEVFFHELGSSAQVSVCGVTTTVATCTEQYEGTWIDFDCHAPDTAYVRVYTDGTVLLDDHRMVINLITDEVVHRHTDIRGNYILIE